MYKHCLVWNGASYNEHKLPPSEAKYKLKHHNAWMLRNIYNWDCGEPTNFWEIINDRPRELNELPSKVRNQVRRCSRDCDIRKISNFDLIHNDGYTVYKKAFERYHDITTKIATREEWERFIENDSVHEFWGVFVKESGMLIAYAMNTIISLSVNYNTLKAIPDYMNKHYPYYGLIFEMNRHYLSNYRYVSDGFRSISEHSNIQPFLEKNFLFRKAYCNLTMYYKPWLKIALILLYPFRNLIPITSIKHILNLEKIAREK